MVIEYLRVRKTSAGVTKTTVLFRGAIAPYLLFCAPFALLHALAKARRGDRVALLVVALFIAAYAPFAAASLLSHRISYIYYFLPSVPSVALAIALLGRAVPRGFRIAFAAATLAAFAMWFPFSA
jgi:hypothetical protein